MNSSQSFSPDSTQLQAVIALCPTLLILNTFHFIRWVTLSLFPFSSVILHEVQSSCLFFCGRKESTAVPQTHLLMAFFLAVCRGVGRSCSFPLHHPLQLVEESHRHLTKLRNTYYRSHSGIVSVAGRRPPSSVV